MPVTALTTKQAYLICLLLIALVALLDGFTALPGHDWGDDFAMYIHHAHNLLAGLPYRETHYLFNPEMSKIGPPAYPPGFPLLLLPVIQLFGVSLPAMKGLVSAFLWSSLLTLFWIFAGQLSFAARLALVALVGFNGVFMRVKEEIISDLPFLFFVLVTLGLLRRPSAWSAGNVWWRQAVWQALLIYACYAIRLAGVVFIPALLWRDWLQQRAITPQTRVTVLLFAVLALLQQQLFPGGEGYLTSLFLDFQWRELPVKLFHNLNYFTLLWGEEKWVRLVLFVSSAPLVALAFLRAWQKGATIIETFSIGYFLLILLWPYTGVRFALPLFPLYFYYLLSALQALPPMRVRQMRVPLWVLFLFAGLAAYALHYQQQWRGGAWSGARDGIHQPYAEALFQYIRQETAPDAVILFNKPRILAWETGRRTSAFTAQDPERLWAYIEKVQASYLIDAILEGGPATPGLQHFIAQHAERLQRVFARGPVVLYRIVSP